MAPTQRDERSVRAVRRTPRRVLPNGPDVEPNMRVVQAVDFISDDPAFAGTMAMTWELSVEHGGTRVEIRADDVPTGISPEDHAAGMQSSLANLAAFLEAGRG